MKIKRDNRRGRTAAKIFLTIITEEQRRKLKFAILGQPFASAIKC